MVVLAGVAAATDPPNVWAADSEAPAIYWSLEVSDRARTRPGLGVEDRCRQAFAAKDKNCAARDKKAVEPGLGRPWWNASDEIKSRDQVASTRAGGFGDYTGKRQRQRQRQRRGGGRGGSATAWEDSDVGA